MKRSTVILAFLAIILLLVIGRGVSALMQRSAAGPGPGPVEVEQGVTVGQTMTATKPAYEVTTIPWETEEIMVATLQSIMTTNEIAQKTASPTISPTTDPTVMRSIIETSIAVWTATAEAAN